ncbi:L-arabinonate dehydratase [Hoeflea sp. G2-23]|uniref:L-arabinonate dehydratase n=1 Tax=Hoeflea algicola TaxID=2983763 RepID=A0ABT3ZDH2_9HYPH|nr:L-arabinonate dehydratase [Hoeflea algicola]MCY0149822.1 L-arabinonate dehydratase [Hoeflea algicola]
MVERRKSKDLRSSRWFAAEDLRGFGHRSRAMQMGYDTDDFLGKPVVAIINTWSDINPCHAHFRNRVEHVKRGVLQGGGFPLELPAMSLSENFVKPTTMLYRNLLAMEVEELLRCHPVDGVVLMGGCDKTTPATVMGAVSMNLPMIFLPAGPMMRGHVNGKIVGSGSDVWKYWAEKEAGNISEGDWRDIEAGIARSHGTCMTMGTASTMTLITEALGLSLPGASSIPAGDSAHPRMSAACGRRIVEMIWNDVTPSTILTRRSFENALVVHNAIAGSTNAIIHLIAMAGRAGVSLTMDDFDISARTTPVIANLRPSGAWLMEDFHIAGGTRALLNVLSPFLHLDEKTISGRTLGENLVGAKVFDNDVIRPLDKPISSIVGTAVLFGNLAPNGCVMKPAAAEARLLRHTGPALVFDNYDDMAKAINDPDLDVTPDHVLILRNAGPVGGPGMPEWGMLPIPRKLLHKGVRDMLRISDARMSGTSYGACILHVSPEAHVGGPLSAVRNGDLISVDVEARSLNLLVPDVVIAERMSSSSSPPPSSSRGFAGMFTRHVTQAHLGCDFDFLEGVEILPEPEIH